MNLFQALILGIIEGISEFLPISSTGHLILVSQIIQISQSDFVKSFEVIIQLGAILAVVVLYWKKLLENRKIWKNVLVAFVPTAVIGFILYKFIKSVLLGNSLVVVWSLLIGGVIMIILEKTHQERQSHTSNIEHLSIKQSFLIGVAQSLSVIPGVSRSAASIMGAMYLGVKRTCAVEFSFLLAIPTMVAATGLDIFKMQAHFSSDQYLTLAVGFIASFLVALFVIRFFLKYIQKHNFVAFGIYRIVVAILFWLTFK